MKKTKSHNSIFFLVFFFLISNVNANSQKNRGYLIRCYTTSDSIGWNSILSSNNFSSFLDINDLVFDSISYVNHERSNEKSLIDHSLTKLFKYKLRLIDNTAYKKDFEDYSCKVNEVVSLDDLAFYDLVYSFADSIDGLNYVVLVNKVDIEYCALNRFSNFDLLFSMRIKLKSSPIFSIMTKGEQEVFVSALSKISNMEGKIFYTRF